MISNTKEAWKTYLDQWRWEWWMTLTTNTRYNYSGILKRYMIDLQKEERLQVAYIGLFVCKGGNHFHLLALGRNRHGKSLLECDPSKWERHWGALAKSSSRILELREPDEQLSRVAYIRNDKNTPEGFYHELDYNLKLLGKTMNG